MMKHKFVEFIPEELEKGIIYISTEYNSINHLCACGCGLEVVTPLSPVDWQFSFNGETVSIFPSIGNWDYPCNSHYWIKKNKIVWANSWSRKEIEEARFNDFSLNYSYSHFDESEKLKINKSNSKKESLLRKLKNLFSFLGFIKRD
ncbi:hypothetical protein LDL76_08770 [Salegentibacter mishustinae]|uniref:DUF6527 family protein n=1 Tax=Salegentibacter mishustinae TaxID=270918 RepID=UPI001CE19F7C|nr:DUF6527 family protein [Salegentibacter mishustinae]UBZ08789.1 hypothetical protein LDL76_08770 [Salegentibacter mishustinae]